MALEFKLPDIGEGVAEGEIVKWLVQEGADVKEHQAIVEVMTDKATVEIPAPAAGKLTKVLAAEGDVVPVGSVIFHLETGGAGAAPAKGAAKPAPPEAKAAAAPEPKAEAKPAPKAEKPEPKAEKPAPDAARPAAKAASPPSGAASGAKGGARAAASKAAGAAPIDFKLPDVGEGVAEGEVVKWLVQAGERVSEHQAIVEVMTDKATVEIPAPAAGTISELLAAEGEVVPVGGVLFRIVPDGAASQGAAQAPAREPAEPTEEAPAEAEPEVEAEAQAEVEDREVPEPVGAGGKVLAVPSARRVARELGVDLARVSGSGRNGIVRRADVEAFARSGAAAPATPAAAKAAPAAKRSFAPTSIAAGQGETRTPFRGVRRKIAEALTRSKYTAVHFTVVEELDVTELVALRAKAKAIGSEDGVNVTYMPFIMKAVAASLAKFPELNSQLDEAAQEIVTFQRVDLGIATDTDQGLIVPVIREVQAKGLLQLASELGELAARTRAGKVRPDELRGSTFTITNAGNIGGTLATPVINFPEVGILGVHRIVKRPGVVETPEGDSFEVRQYMNLSISVDHRLVDGATAVRFLVHMKTLLENPGLIAL